MINNIKAKTKIVADGIQRDFYFEFDVWLPAGQGQVLLFLKDGDGTVAQITDRSKMNVDLQNKKVTYPYNSSGGESLPPVKKDTIVIIARYLLPQQTFDFVNNGIIPKTVEDAVDYEMLVIQQIDDGVEQLIAGYDFNSVVKDLVDGQKYLSEEIDDEVARATAAEEELEEAISKRVKSVQVNGETPVTPDADGEIAFPIVSLEKSGALTAEQFEKFTNKLDSIQYPDGTDPRSIRKPGPFYINNAAGSISYPLPPAVPAANRCFGFCKKGKEQYYGEDIYNITAVFFGVGYGAGVMEVINSSGYYTVVCEAVLYLNIQWQEVSPVNFKDYFRAHMFTRISGGIVNVIPAPVYASGGIVFNLDDCSVITKTADGYLRVMPVGDFNFATGNSFMGNLFFAMPLSYIYNMGSLIRSEYQIINDTFDRVEVSGFLPKTLVYSSIENRFCYTTNSTDWTPAVVGYLGKYKITMDDAAGTNFNIKVLRQGKKGLSLWPYDPAIEKSAKITDLVPISQVIDPPMENTEYYFGLLSSLELKNIYQNEYKITVSFGSGSTPTALTLPAGTAVIGVQPLSIAANKRYKLVIENGEVTIYG